MGGCAAAAAHGGAAAPPPPNQDITQILKMAALTERRYNRFAEFF